MADQYAQITQEQNYSSAAAVTPGSTAFAPTRALYVGADGNVTVQMADDTGTVTFVGVVAGTVLPISVIKVTAAAGGNIVALR